MTSYKDFYDEDFEQNAIRRESEEEPLSSDEENETQLLKPAFVTAELNEDKQTIFAQTRVTDSRLVHEPKIKQDNFKKSLRKSLDSTSSLLNRKIRLIRHRSLQQPSRLAAP